MSTAVIKKVIFFILQESFTDGDDYDSVDDEGKGASKEKVCTYQKGNITIQ